MVVWVRRKRREREREGEREKEGLESRETERALNAGQTTESATFVKDTVRALKNP